MTGTGHRSGLVLLSPVGSSAAAYDAAVREAHAKGATHVCLRGTVGEPSAAVVARLAQACEVHPRDVLVHSGAWTSADFWVLRTTGCDVSGTRAGSVVFPIECLLALPRPPRWSDTRLDRLVRAAWAGAAIVEVEVDLRVEVGNGSVAGVQRLGASTCSAGQAYWTFLRLVLRRLVPTRRARAETAATERPRVRLRDTWTRLRSMATHGKRPSELALAVGIGALIGASPLWGLHGFLAVYIGLRLHLNLMAAFVGSNVSLPFIAPVLVFASVQCGHVLLRGHWMDLRPENLDPSIAWESPLYYVLGSIPVAVVVAVALTCLTYASVSLVRAARRGRGGLAEGAEGGDGTARDSMSTDAR